MVDPRNLAIAAAVCRLHEFGAVCMRPKAPWLSPSRSLAAFWDRPVSSLARRTFTPNRWVTVPRGYSSPRLRLGTEDHRLGVLAGDVHRLRLGASRPLEGGDPRA